MEDGDGDTTLGDTSTATPDKYDYTSGNLMHTLKSKSTGNTPSHVGTQDGDESDMAQMEKKSPTLIDNDVPKVKVNGDAGTVISRINEDSDLSVSNKPEPICDGGVEESTSLDESTKDEVEKKTRKRKMTDSPVLNNIVGYSGSEDHDDLLNVVKKRILCPPSALLDVDTKEATSLATVTENSDTPLSEDVGKGASEIITSVSQGLKCTSEKKTDDVGLSTPQAEYAQYLGLQPTVKFKCFNCGETGFRSMLVLQEHQNACLANVKVQPIPKPISAKVDSDLSPSTNFRITRKVYLCSSCGTYYENWNLFLHMRQVHKRHVCLFCLTMFNQAEKLAQHLMNKHGIEETVYTSPEHLFNECNGSCFLMCIACECVFSERDNFLSHGCVAVSVVHTDKPCSLCNFRGQHSATCHLAAADVNSLASTSQRSVIESPPGTSRSQHLHPNPSVVAKYVIPVSADSSKKTNKILPTEEGNQEKSFDFSDNDDDYDMSNAASFCHVNIHEPVDKQDPVVVLALKTDCTIKVSSDAASNSITCKEDVAVATDPQLNAVSQSPNSVILDVVPRKELMAEEMDACKQTLSSATQPTVENIVQPAETSPPDEKNSPAADRSSFITRSPDGSSSPPVEVHPILASAALESSSLNKSGQESGMNPPVVCSSALETSSLNKSGQESGMNPAVVCSSAVESSSIVVSPTEVGSVECNAVVVMNPANSSPSVESSHPLKAVTKSPGECSHAVIMNPVNVSLLVENVSPAKSNPIKNHPADCNPTVNNSVESRPAAVLSTQVELVHLEGGNSRVGSPLGAEHSLSAENSPLAKTSQQIVSCPVDLLDEPSCKNAIDEDVTSCASDDLALAIDVNMSSESELNSSSPLLIDTEAPKSPPVKESAELSSHVETNGLEISALKESRNGAHKMFETNNDYSRPVETSHFVSSSISPLRIALSNSAPMKDVRGSETSEPGPRNEVYSVSNVNANFTPHLKKPVKRARRRRSNLTMKGSKAKGKARAKKNEEMKPKAPLTVKFKLIKSSTNMNYSASLDNSQIESDMSDSEKHNKYTASSSDSASNADKTRKWNWAKNREGFTAEASIEEPSINDNIQIAGEEVPAIEIYSEEKWDTLTIQNILQECVKAACLNCVYCNHAKKIAVNGKQLGMHLLAEHRFIPLYKNEDSSLLGQLLIDEPTLKDKPLFLNGEGSNELTADESETLRDQNIKLMKDLTNRIKIALPTLQNVFLNTDTYDSSDRTFVHPYDRTYECFHCNFLTTLHKELYVHNRKMHQKTILLCIMCKSNFYSYSELLCHLCPGIYVPDNEIKFRCCVCLVDNFPSAFRLMVHLRKRHHTCDVCLETTEDQQKLSNHVWKHKLHHLCYRCGIAYRNKPDITKHLFWKHGTESVLCKKCLQKKWPHVYHFCIPPVAFICEECSASFSKAVALKVHKRQHAGDFPYGCEECEERFVSKRLREKHQDKHKEVPALITAVPEESVRNAVVEDHSLAVTNIKPQQELSAIIVPKERAEDQDLQQRCASAEFPETPSDEPTAAAHVPHVKKHVHKKQKAKVMDVYDLPPLNLSSESDDSETEKEVKRKDASNSIGAVQPVDEVKLSECTILEAVGTTHAEDEMHPHVPTVDGVWDNFQNYKANLERRESQTSDCPSVLPNSLLSFPLCSIPCENALGIVLRDHDYCLTNNVKSGEPSSLAGEVNGNPSSIADDSKLEELKNSFDHDYCTNNNTTETNALLEEQTVKLESQIPTLNAQTKESPSKKKQKLLRKRKRNTSSSSSDSSSNSSSSSCSCGTNCSCSSSSSSSSGSTSDSSESDSSSSEGRRLQIARRLKRREHGKKKKEEATISTEPTNGVNVPVQEEEQQPPLPPEPEEEPVCESDLYTDETETDEDFYDKHPQLLANKLMAEKRNQLLLLAAVAPVNNVPETAVHHSPQHNTTKKKVKSKKRKKHQHESERKAESKLKHPVSPSYYIPTNQMFNPETIVRQPVQSQTLVTTSANSLPTQFSQTTPIPKAIGPTSRPSAAYSTGSGSETDSKRLSKRRRLPKKFYGDSSDDEPSTPTPKWSRNIPAVSSTPVSYPPLTPPVYKPPSPEPARVPPIIIVPDRAVPDKSEEEEEGDVVDSESEQETKKTSSECSSNSEQEKEADSDAGVSVPQVVPPLVVYAPGASQQKKVNLYCYCQCPYDEVSEMIACDGSDCVIEWFHFECVGIMVPPKGKWYCPDCRKNATGKS